MPQSGERGLRSFRPEMDSYAKFSGNVSTEVDVSTAGVKTIELFFAYDAAGQGTTDAARVFHVAENAGSGTFRRHAAFIIWDSDGSHYDFGMWFRENTSASTNTALTISNIPEKTWLHAVGRYRANGGDPLWQLDVGAVGQPVADYTTSTASVTGGATSIYPIGDGPNSADAEGLTQIIIGARDQLDNFLSGMVAIVRVWSTERTDTELETYAVRHLDSYTGCEHEWCLQNTSGNTVCSATGAVELAYTLGDDGEQGFGELFGSDLGIPPHPFIRNVVVGGGC